MMSLKRTNSDSSNLSSSFGAHSSGSTPYPSSSSKSSGSTSTSLSSNESIDRNSFKRPKQFQTQAHTSSSSSSIPTEPVVHTKSNEEYKPNKNDMSIESSQDLFAGEGKEILQSTPFTSSNTQTNISYIHAKSKNDISMSPTQPLKIVFSSSSSDDEKRRIPEHPDSLGLPTWCITSQGQSPPDITQSGTQDIKDPKKYDDSDSPVQKKPDDLSETFESSEESVSVMKRDNSASQDDDHIQSESENKGSPTSQSQLLPLQFELAQDFASSPLNFEEASQVFNPGHSEERDKQENTQDNVLETTDTNRKDDKVDEDNVVPQTQLQNIPQTQLQNIPQTQLQNIPQTQLQNIPQTQLENVVPQTQLENVVPQMQSQEDDNVDKEQQCSSSSGVSHQIISDLKHLRNQLFQMKKKKKNVNKEWKKEVEKLANEIIILTNQAGGNESVNEDSVMQTLPGKDKGNDISIGLSLFGLWGGQYYPGKVSKIDKSNERYFVEFFDSTSTWLKKTQIVFQNQLKINDKVSVKVNSEYYDEAVLVEIKSEDESDDDKIYKVKLVQEETTKFVALADLCLLHNEAETQTVKKRKTSQAFDCSSTSPEVSYSRRRKIRRVEIENVPLFANHHFIISIENDCLDDGNVSTDSEVNSEDEKAVVDVVNIIASIKEHGGKILSTINQREIQAARTASNVIICISNRPLKTIKYLYSVATGIPILHYQWVYQSVQLKVRQEHETYILPAGFHITGEVIKQNIDKSRENYTPLFGVKIYFHLGKEKSYGRELNLLLKTVGCERIFDNHFVTHKTKRLTFSLANVDFVCTLTEKIPSILWNEAVSAEKPVVTSEWIYQCLLTNQLLDVVDCPLFLYKHLKSANNSQQKKQD